MNVWMLLRSWLMRIQTCGIELISKDGYEKAMDQWHKQVVDKSN
jgi:hypothetical protein